MFSESAVTIEILEFLDWKSLLTCRMVCTEFRDIIDLTSSLQFKIELALAGREDCGHYDLFTRREMLKRYEDGWNNLGWTTECRLDELDSYWEMCGNILAEQKRGPPSIRFNHLPSQSRSIGEREWSMDAGCSRLSVVGLDPGQDLLVLLERKGTHVYFEIHLRTISTGKLHPLAPGHGTIIYEAVGTAVRIGTVEIYSHVLAILFQGGGISPSERRVVIWNWKTGKVTKIIESGQISSMLLIDEKFVLFGAVRQTLGRSEPCLTVVDYVSGPVQIYGLNASQNSFTFNFPPLAYRSTILDLQIQSNSVPTWTPNSLFPVPFALAPHNRCFAIYIQFTQNFMRTLCFVISGNSLLSLIQGASRTGKEFDWNMWGPDNTRIIPNVQHVRGWREFLYGSRFVYTRSTTENGICIDVYDFNQYKVRNQEMDSTTKEERRNSVLPSKFRAGTFFQDNVETKLGYSVRSCAVHGIGFRPISAMCIEDGIIIVGYTSTGDGKFLILTV